MSGNHTIGILKDAAEYVGAVAKTLKRLKKSLGATTIRQGYKATGYSAGTSVQVFVRFPDESCCDIWLGPQSVTFRPLYGGPEHGCKPANIETDGTDPEATYRQIESNLRTWLLGGLASEHIKIGTEGPSVINQSLEKSINDLVCAQYLASTTRS